MTELFKTTDGVSKYVGDAYYCVQDGTATNHHYPFEIQLIKIEDPNRCTSKKLDDSILKLSDSGIKRFHSKRVAVSWCKYITKLNKIIKQNDEK
jgi:hypothetical protein